MEPTSPRERSPVAIAAAWASRILAVSMEMVLPALVGWWVDRRLETGVVFLLVGLGLGMVVGMWHLVQIARALTVRDRAGAKQAHSRGERHP